MWAKMSLNARISSNFEQIRALFFLFAWFLDSNAPAYNFWFMKSYFSLLVVVLSGVFVAGCGAARIPVDYDYQAVVSEASEVCVSAARVNPSIVCVRFDDLPDGVLVSPADIRINGKPVSAVWKYYPRDPMMLWKPDHKTKPFTTFLEKHAGGRWLYSLWVDFECPKDVATVSIDFSRHMTLRGKPVFPKPVVLSL
jgi:hypothetical protein